jgi:glutathione S-transferase
MTLTIYGDSISGNCLKVKWTADKLGFAYDWVEVDVVKGETRTDAFRTLNPSAQVPTVVLADGRPLAQSNAIIWHLAEGSDLIPTDAYLRAKALEWLFWEQYSHEPYVAVRRFQKHYLNTPDAEIDPKLMQRGEAALGRMETWLAGSPYLVDGRCPSPTSRWSPIRGSPTKAASTSLNSPASPPGSAGWKGIWGCRKTVGQGGYPDVGSGS